jgi:DNA-binding Xre family transcriptional regulator
MISYQPLWITLAKKGMKKKDLYSVASSATVARMGRGEYIALEVLDKICTELDCPIEEVIEWKKDE